MTTYFSICIPQYNRTDFLIKACRTFTEQSFRDFEICISDDCSNDGKEGLLRNYLAESGMKYVYKQTPSNLGYDANLRRAISFSSGKYVLLMGNDDGLSRKDALKRLHEEIERAPDTAVAIANYRETSSGRVFARVHHNGVIGSGPEVATRMFRNYSFVSGVVLAGAQARALATDMVDGSEMYQMYLATRLVSDGGQCLAVADVLIDKDLQIPDQSVDSYRNRPRVWPCPIIKRPLPMGRLLDVVASGIRCSTESPNRDELLYQAARDLYVYTYAFWGIEYRRVQSWRYAAGVLLALSPSEIAATQPLSRRSRVKLWAIYLASMSLSLSVPIRIFDITRGFLYKLAKRSK